MSAIKGVTINGVLYIDRADVEARDAAIKAGLQVCALSCIARSFDEQIAEMLRVKMSDDDTIGTQKKSTLVSIEKLTAAFLGLREAAAMVETFFVARPPEDILDAQRAINHDVTDVGHIARLQGYGGEDDPPLNQFTAGVFPEYNPTAHQIEQFYKTHLKTRDRSLSFAETARACTAIELILEPERADEALLMRVAEQSLDAVKRNAARTELLARMEARKPTLPDIRDEWDNLPDAEPEGIVRRPR